MEPSVLIRACIPCGLEGFGGGDCQTTINRSGTTWSQEYFKSLRAAREQLNHQIAMSRKTIAATQEYLRKLDEMLEGSLLKP
jgi:hypothetical protein